MALASYSRGQESEADTLGIRYLSRAGYEPNAMAGFLSQMEADARLQAAIAGNPGQADQFNILQTHPRTADRVRDAAAQAGGVLVRDPMTNQAVYYRNLEGVVYGDSAEQGFVRGRKFLHPVMRFAFEVPEGFRLANRPTRVEAHHPNGSLILADAAGKEASRQYEVGQYLTRVWAKNATLSSVERIEVNGLQAATGVTEARLQSGPATLRLLAIRLAPDQIIRFLFVTPKNLTNSMALGLRETTYSFRRLSASEAAALKPYRIRIHEVRAGETLAGLAARLPFEDYREERFRVLNGIPRGQGVRPGDLVKLISE